MKKVSFFVKYEIGEKIKYDNGIYVVLGYEFVKSRGIRYVLLSHDGGKVLWDFLYDFEIKMLLK